MFGHRNTAQGSSPKHAHHLDKERLTWKQMEERYPNQWLSITDYTTDDADRLESGIVECHSTDMRQVARAPAQSDGIAFRDAVESTF